MERCSGTPDLRATDLSGSSFTVATETELERLAEWQRYIVGAFAVPDFGRWFARTMPLVESGRREIYTIEA